MKSFTYYLTLLFIKLKGLKKEFSKAPINYKSLRKADVHNPGSRVFQKFAHRRFKVATAEITEINPTINPDKIILFCHGGAFIFGPVDYHWSCAIDLSRRTGSTVWMIDYPKAPEANILEISNTVEQVYEAARKNHPFKKVILAGDSVGGTLLTALVQRLIIKEQMLPSLLVLISPVMDASFSNPGIKAIEENDPILARKGALSAKKMAAGGEPLHNPIISPLFGSFSGFPETHIFIAENDITRPDQELAVQRMKDHNVPLNVTFGSGMPHIWPLLPVMREAKSAFTEIVSSINEV